MAAVFYGVCSGLVTGEEEISDCGGARDVQSCDEGNAVHRRRVVDRESGHGARGASGSISYTNPRPLLIRDSSPPPEEAATSPLFG